MTTELLRPVTSSRALELYPFQTEAIESLRVAARTGLIVLLTDWGRW